MFQRKFSDKSNNLDCLHKWRLLDKITRLCIIFRTKSRSGEGIGPQFRSQYYNARFPRFSKENSQIRFTGEFSRLRKMELRIRRRESLIYDEALGASEQSRLNLKCIIDEAEITNVSGYQL